LFLSHIQIIFVAISPQDLIVGPTKTVTTVKWAAI